MPGKYRRYIEFGGLVLLAGALIWWFGRGLDWSQVKESLRQSDWRLIALACVVVLLAYLWRALRWHAFLAPLCKAGMREIWIATTVGYGAVLTIGRTGEVVRPLVLSMKDRRVRPAASFVTIMIERVYDTMTIVFVFALNLLWFVPTDTTAKDFGHVRQLGFVFIVLGAVGIGLLILFRIKSAGIIGWTESLLDAWPRVPSRLKRAVLGVLDQLARALAILGDVRDLAVTLGWTVSLWLSITLANLLVIRAFHVTVSGSEFGFKQSLFILGFSMVGSAVPTPGGAAGAFHKATAAGLIFLGVKPEQAAAVAIVLHLVDFGPAAVFGLFYLLRGEISLSRLRELMEPEAIEHAVEDEKIARDETAKQQNLEAVGARE